MAAGDAFGQEAAGGAGVVGFLVEVEDGGHGDAAFADYVLIFSYFKRFGGSEQPPVPQQTTIP